MRQSAFHSGFVDQGQVASKCALVTDVFAALWEVLGGSQEPDEEETKEDEKAVPVSPSPGSFLSGPLKTSAQVCELVQDDTAIKWKKLATKTLREVRFPSFSIVCEMHAEEGNVGAIRGSKGSFQAELRAHGD